MLRNTEDLPEHLLEPEGFLGDFVRCVRQSAEYDLPELALQAGLCTLAAIVSRKVLDYRNTRPNILTIGVAPTGAGKEHPRQIVKELLEHSNLLGQEKFTSGSAIARALSERPTMLSVCDEVGLWVKAATSERSGPYLQQIVGALLESYSASGSKWRAMGYASSEQNISVDRPHFILQGSTTQSTLFEGLTAEQVSNGLLGRLLVFTSPGCGYVRRRRFQMPDIGEDLTQFVDDWLGCGGADDGDLAMLNPEPVRIEIDDEARERVETHLDDISQRRVGEEPVSAALWSRSGEKSSKLILLAACSRFDGSGFPRISLADADWGIGVANHTTRRLVSLIHANVAGSVHELRLQKILRIISEAGGVISKSDLCRRSHFVKTRERNELVEQLRESGDLFDCCRAENKTRPQQGYATSLEAIKRQGWIWLSPELLEAEAARQAQERS